MTIAALVLMISWLSLAFALDMSAAGTNYLSRAASLIAQVDPRPVTVSYWYFGPIVNGSDDYSYILNNNFGGSENFSIYTVHVGGGVCHIAVYSGGNEYVTDDFTWDATAWNHVAITWTSGDSLKFYLNGSLIKTVTAAIGGGGDVSAAALGTYDGSDPLFHIYGTLAEFAVWSAILNDNEIAALARGAQVQRLRRGNLVTHLPLIQPATPMPDYAGGIWTQHGTPVKAGNPPVLPY